MKEEGDGEDPKGLTVLAVAKHTSHRILLRVHKMTDVV